MKKRLFCALLCVLLLAGLSVFAFADQEAMSAEEECMPFVPPVPCVNIIPTPATTVRIYTGSPFAITDFIDAGEPILANAVLYEINGHNVQTDPVEIINAGTYKLKFCANFGYVFEDADDCNVFGCSWKTIEVVVLPAAIPTLGTEVIVHDGQPHAAAEFLTGEAKDLFLLNTKIVAVNGGEPAEMVEGGSYDVTFEITNPNYVFAEPDDPAVPTVKTYKCVIALTVKFDVGGLTVAPANQIVTKGSKVVKPADPVVEGYDFDGWFKEFACENPWDFDKDVVLQDTTIFAKFTKLFTVTFDENGHGVAPAAQTVRNGELATKPADLTEEGWEFGGWFKDEACTVAWDFTKDQVRQNVTLFAKWTENKCTVTFDAQGHGIAPAAQKVVKGGNAVKPADLTEDGFEFGGWFKEAECTNAWNFETDKVESDVTLYAKWTKVTKMCTVTFDVQGHGKAPAAQTVAQGSKIVKPANPSASGYFFVGWYTDKACKTQWKFNTNTVEKDMVLYAKWTSNNPKTGDTENLGFYAALSLCSLAAAAVVVLGDKKRREK